MPGEHTERISATFQPGSSFGDYRVRRPIGRGGFGTVYLADHPAHGKVALKLLLDPRDGESEQRFVREAGLHLSHPGIPRIFEQGAIHGVPYMAQELIEGQSLAEILAVGPIPEPRAIALAAAICDVLDHAHARSVVHRDLKPENIIVRGDGSPAILDFGIARVLNLDTLSTDGTFLGSPRYMAPEQILGESVEAAADLYSLGVCLYQMVTGKLPIEGHDLTALLFAVVHRVPPPPSTQAAGVSRALDVVVARLLSKRPSDRYGSAAEVASVLRDAAAGIVHESGRPPQGRDRGVPLLGREAELERLLELAAEACEGSLRLAAISGETGIGKTLLCEELERSVTSLPMQHCVGRAVAMGAVPYQPILSALRGFLKERSVDDAEDLLPFASDHARELLPVLEVARGILFGLEKVEAFGREQVWEVLRRLLSVVAAERPTLCVLEDMHHADEGTLLAIGFLARSLSAPLLLVLTYRSEVVAAGHPLHALLDELRPVTPVLEVPLQRLPREIVGRLCAALLPETTIASELAERVHRESEGNPLYAVEVVRHLSAGGALHEEGGELKLSDLAGPVVPPRVSEVISQRLERLSPLERDLLDVAAVDGEEFGSDVVAEVSGEGRIKVLKTLRDIETVHRLIHARESSYRFDHGKVRDIVYGLLPAELRQEYHRAIAEHLEERHGEEQAARVAHHYEAGGLPKRAAPFLLRAARHAASVFANDVALDLYGRFLKVDPSPTETLHALCERGDILLIRGRPAQAMVDFRGALDLGVKLQDGAGQALALRSMAKSHKSQGEYSQAIACHERAIALLPERGTSEEALGLSGMSEVALGLGDLPQALAHAERGLRLAVERGDRKAQAGCLIPAAYVFFRQGRIGEAATRFERARDLYRQEGYRRGEAVMLTNIGNLPSAPREERRGRYEEAFRLFREIGDRGGEAIVTMNLALVQEKADEKLRLLRDALEMQRAIGDRTELPRTLIHLATALRESGRLDEARARACEALELCRETAAKLLEAWALVELADGAREQGDRHSALELLAHAFEILHATGASEGEADTLIRLGDIHASGGAKEEARRCYAQALDVATSAGIESAAELARARLSKLTQGLP